MNLIILIDICIMALFGFYIAQAVMSSRHDADMERRSLRPVRPCSMIYTIVDGKQVRPQAFAVVLKKITVTRVPPQNITFQFRVVDKTNGLLQ